MKKARESGALEHALIENIQRKDLNHIEEALCIQRLIDECQMSLQAAANAVGRSSSATSNLLQLLKLSQPVQAMFMAGDLEIGHARVLLPLEETTQIAVANKIIQGGLSVRAAEKLVKSELTPIVKQEHK
jgi:ParB family chromosome partitioning protein